MASGWTGQLISPNLRVHDAASAAIDHVGTKDSIAALHPSHPEFNSANLTSRILHDPTLGSRGTGVTSHPSTLTPVGSASTFQNAGIPATIASALNNLGSNTQNAQLMSILNRVLGGTTQGQVTSSPAQDEYFRTQAALSAQRLQAAQAPGLIQKNIDLLNQQSPINTSPTPALPGQYAASAQAGRDRALQALYGQQAAAKQAAGWTAPTY